MPHLVAALAALLVAVVPAQAAGGLTRAKAERLVERKVARGSDGEATVNAECRRTSPRSFACGYTATGVDCATGRREGSATVTKRRGRPVRVTVRSTVATFCDSG